MATIRSFTSLEQSRKLAEILPLESADMYYVLIDSEKDLYSASLGKYIGILPHHPAWSLAALLEQLPYELCDDDGNSTYLQMNKDDDLYQLVYTEPYDNFESIETNRYKHFIDTCYELILKLHKLNLL